MPATLQELQLGIVKEAVRGTLISPATIHHAIAGDSVMDLAPQFIEDEAKRGINANFASERGVNVGAGTLKAPLRASDFGEYLHMAIGNPVSALITAALAYRHTFTGPEVGNQRPTYSAHLNRGAAIGVKAYNRVSVNTLTVSQDETGLMQWEAAVLFQAEVAGNVGAPDFSAESEEFAPGQARFQVGGANADDVKSWSFTINNNMLAQRTQNGSRDIKDIIARGPVKIEGEFLIYFEDLVERDKFLAGTQVQLGFIATSEEIIETAQAYDLRYNLPTAKYKAYPYGEDEGLFAASVTFEGEYDLASSSLFDVELINKKSAY